MFDVTLTVQKMVAHRKNLKYTSLFYLFLYWKILLCLVNQFHSISFGFIRFHSVSFSAI